MAEGRKKKRIRRTGHLGDVRKRGSRSRERQLLRGIRRRRGEGKGREVKGRSRKLSTAGERCKLNLAAKEVITVGTCSLYGVRVYTSWYYKKRKKRRKKENNKKEKEKEKREKRRRRI